MTKWATTFLYQCVFLLFRFVLLIPTLPLFLFFIPSYPYSKSLFAFSFSLVFNLLQRPFPPLSYNTKCSALQVRRGADKSLARPTSPCCRTESIVSLERGVWSCAELKVFSCYTGWKKRVRRRARFQQHKKREMSSSFFFSCKARRQTKFTPFWQEH